MPSSRFSIPPQAVNSISIRQVCGNSYINLCQGDLTLLEADVLVVSAFPDDYTPLPNSLIGTLYQKGISVAELSKDKAVDLRASFSCWLSKDVQPQPGYIGCRKILCFEPYSKGHPPQMVGDIFRSLAPFVGGDSPVRTIAIPLVTAGYQGSEAVEILRLIVDAAAHWISIGLPIKCLNIGFLPGENTNALLSVFAELKNTYSDLPVPQVVQPTYDVFMSYSHVNQREADWFESQMIQKKKDIRIFLDRKELNAGVSWQHEIFEALDHCRKVLALFSPAYLASKICLEEFNIGMYRQRETGGGVLYPVYLYSAELPTYMRLCQSWDCREFKHDFCKKAIDDLVREIS